MSRIASRTIIWVTWVGVLTLASGCEKAVRPPNRIPALESPAAAELPPEVPMSEWDKKRWIDRTARKLRAGTGLKPGELTVELLALSQSQIIDRLMNDDRFGDAVLDFNLYFLGLKPDSLRSRDGSFTYVVWDTPNALGSAMSLFAKPGTPGADYLNLFDLKHPYYIRPLTRPRSENAEDAGKPDDEVRITMLNRYQNEIDELITYAERNPTVTGGELARRFFLSPGGSDWFYTGMDVGFMIWAQQARDWMGSLVLAFYAEFTPSHGWPAELRAIRARNEPVIALVKRLTAEKYAVRTLRDVQSWDVARELQLRDGWTMFNPIYAQHLAGSSTNFNRKRAAFVLKRFFCDDLIPINVSAPADHARGRHASEPSCQSCHYKLDPMAGAFRNIGFNMMNLSDSPVFTFDDKVKVNKAAFQQSWLAQPRSGRTWDIGYVRSTDHPDRNVYFDDLDGLFAFIRKAPEARRCLMRRMFEYTVGENQAVDAGYLDDLTERFNDETLIRGSVPAIKLAMKRVLMSRAFSERDRQSDRCYDLPAGVNPQDRPPCRVAYLLDKNCTACHSSSSMKGNLDLSRWVKNADGGMGFVHMDGNGNPLPRAVTFQALIDRLDTTDETARMPLNRYMPSHERTETYVWAQEALRQAVVGRRGGRR